MYLHELDMKTFFFHRGLYFSQIIWNTCKKAKTKAVNDLYIYLHNTPFLLGRLTDQQKHKHSKTDPLYCILCALPPSGNRAHCTQQCEHTIPWTINPALTWKTGLLVDRSTLGRCFHHPLPATCSQDFGELSELRRLHCRTH